MYRYYMYKYIHLSEFVKTWTLGFRLSPGAAQIQCTGQKMWWAWRLGRHMRIAQELP